MNHRDYRMEKLSVTSSTWMTLSWSEQDIDLLIHTTRIYSSDIQMSSRLHKCSQIVTKRGKAIRTEGIALPLQPLRIATSTLGSHRKMGTMKRLLGKPQAPNTCRE